MVHLELSYYFQKLVECREVLCGELDLQPEDVELSMGMSSDYEHAVCITKSK